MNGGAREEERLGAGSWDRRVTAEEGKGMERERVTAAFEAGNGIRRLATATAKC